MSVMQRFFEEMTVQCLKKIQAELERLNARVERLETARKPKSPARRNT